MRAPDIEIQIVVSMREAITLPDTVGSILSNVVEDTRKFTVWCAERPGQQAELQEAFDLFVSGLWKSMLLGVDIAIVPRIGHFYGGGSLPEHFLESEFVAVGECFPVSLVVRRGA